MRQHFRILDLDLTLSAPAAILEPISFAYRRFQTAEPRPDAVRIELVSASARCATVGGRSVPLVESLDKTAQLYQLVLDALMDGIGSCAVLHAAALLEPSGGVLLLAAPSGHGKSSLTLEMVRRGLRFLGDDYAPLDLGRCMVHPYPRAVGLTGNGAEQLGEPFHSAALDAAGHKLMGKSLLDVGRLVGAERLVDRAAPLRHVVLLASGLEGAPPPSRSLLRLACRAEDADELAGVFGDTPGVAVLARQQDAQVCYWRLRLDHLQHPTPVLSRVLESERVLFVERFWDSRPDFAVAPAAARICRREAAEFLGRELLNRRGGGRLLARFGGSVAALFVSLAGALRNADCFRVRVGDRSATATLLEELMCADA